MNITEFAVRNQIITYFTVALLVVAGLYGFFSLGQLEDPAFTVKTAVIVTPYPGASAVEVEQEVTDRIEGALQEMPELDALHSLSRAGSSLIKVEIKPEYWSDSLPQVWDKLRRKVNDIQGDLPDGVAPSQVSDDFGDVFGLLLGVVGYGYSYHELEHHTKQLQKEMSLVEGVARVDIWGIQDAAVFIDVTETQLAKLGVAGPTIKSILEKQNLVVDAGHVEVGSQRYNIHPSGAFRSPADIGDLLIPGQNEGSDSDSFIHIRDIGTIREGYTDPPNNLMRLNGQPGLVLAISNVSGTNVVDMGQRVSQRLDELQSNLPVGIELERIHWQSDIVDDAVNSFLINFAEAVIIVLVVLTIAMGWKMAVIIGTALTLTILSTFLAMAVFGIDLHRMSLGALIIALGMMVDNAIVVAESYVVRVKDGEEKEQAAITSATRPSMSLLGATVIAIMAFYPIFASTEAAGEYCRSLFIVVAISLLASWFVSLTITPLQCIHMLDLPTTSDQQESRWLRGFREILEKTLHLRWLTVGSTIVLLIIALIAFGNVKQIFFPDSSMTKFMVDYWAPESTRIQQTADSIQNIEKHLLDDARIKDVAAFIGQGSPRFYLPVDPESPYSSYGQLIVNVQSLDVIDDVVKELDHWLAKNVPEALTRVRKYSVGPGQTWKFEARFLGPSKANPAVLRDLAQQGLDILRTSPLAKEVSTDWRQPTLQVVPVYSQLKGRNAGISRDDLANVTKRVYDGVVVGTYRNDDDELPIIWRDSIAEREASSLDTLQIQPPNQAYTVPLGQVTDDIDTEWTDPLIWRYNRHRAITVRATPDDTTTVELRASVIDAFNDIELPPGYSLRWFGEHKSTVDSQASLIPGVVPALAIIVFILVALFNAMRPMLLIVTIIPFVMIGVSIGLLSTNAAFGFVSLLGVMSLAGMMIKNSVVLVDQINIEKAAGKSEYQAIVDGTVSRLRPVFLAAATTVLGVLPLLSDVFWQGLAISIMAGLSFGTLLTMLLLPVFYSIYFRVQSNH
ncbi:MAG: efflux RND transporter permease subunit [Candidatus Thiodiazotropha sp. (ex Codakia rugifera)]|nr:efflux RND transporter permease subunit [Candidatus Thiodiazotropha sp. (ex Codakia rugifera)]